MNKQALTELLSGLLAAREQTEGQPAEPGHLALPRLRTGLLRADWSEEEKDHLRRCAACQKAKEQMSREVWHPTAPQLFRHLRGRLTGDDAIDVNYHLTEDQCRHCRAVLTLLADASRMLAADAPELRAAFAA